MPPRASPLPMTVLLLSVTAAACVERDRGCLNDGASCVAGQPRLSTTTVPSGESFSVQFEIARGSAGAAYGTVDLLNPSVGSAGGGLAERVLQACSSRTCEVTIATPRGLEPGRYTLVFSARVEDEHSSSGAFYAIDRARSETHYVVSEYACTDDFAIFGPRCANFEPSVSGIQIASVEILPTPGARPYYVETFAADSPPEADTTLWIYDPFGGPFGGGLGADAPTGYGTARAVSEDWPTGDRYSRATIHLLPGQGVYIRAVPAWDTGLGGSYAIRVSDAGFGGAPLPPGEPACNWNLFSADDLALGEVRACRFTHDTYQHSFFFTAPAQ